jgi:3-deoxy-D-manno-octulosonate 8-phosphate phosphatase KdsC-like HAD superfamily phosphatase
MSIPKTKLAIIITERSQKCNEANTNDQKVKFIYLCLKPDFLSNQKILQSLNMESFDIAQIGHY